METLKILLTSSMCLRTPPDDYGGSELIVALLGRELSKRGHEVKIACSRGSRENYERMFGRDNVEFIEGPPPDPSNPEHLLAEKYKDVIGDYEIVNSHGWTDAPHRLRKDVWQTLHGPYPPVIHRSRNICVSKAHKRHIEDFYGFPCRYAYNSIEPSLYKYSEDKDDFLLFLSRISAEKGALEFIEVCRRTGMKGVIAGDDILISDPRYVSEVIYQAEKNGVKYLGRVDHKTKIELLSRARALIAPIKYFEIFGIYFVEAGISGTPVIALNRGAVPELIVHGKTGFIANGLDEIVEYIPRLDEINPRDCRSWALKFSPERMAERYEEIYRGRPAPLG